MNMGLFERAACTELTHGREADPAGRDEAVEMLLAARDDIDEMAKRTGQSRFPSVAQMGGWRRMLDSVAAALRERARAADEAAFWREAFRQRVEAHNITSGAPVAVAKIYADTAVLQVESQIRMASKR